MIARAIALTALCLSLIFAGQGGAEASEGRVVARKTHTNANIVKVPIRNGQLQVGNELTHTVYTWDKGDPPCDPTGRTVYFGHAWRSGNGVADRWGSFRKGNIIKVAGCKFRVTRREYWSEDRSIRPLFRSYGAPQIVLFGCKADDYSKRVLVFARKI